jgi:type II secretory ATPase GspE/PulE/Tfp pilus assembly ATPase PilB-like protein
MSRAEEDKALQISVADLGPEELVARAIEHGADLAVSDIYFITNENHVAIKARHLGLQRLLTIIPLDLGRRCLAHIKALSGMDVTERRRPLDGRWIYRRPSGSTIDLRISTIPTLYGEDFTLRLLPRDFRMLGMENLGMLRAELNLLFDLLNSPSGLILVTGPTGSGKTTTLYAFLNYLNNGERKINTIEDPIEYAMEGARQSQVAPRFDIDFADLLRGVLRQAPDVIMVGEVRDQDTAATVVRAANSGHLVLATLHAPVAAGAIQSMLSLGVHPHFLSSSLLGTVAQRLVRTLCPDCKVAYDLADSPMTFEDVKKWLAPEEGHALYGPGPQGCPRCRMLGYVGRTGVFEVFPVDREIRRMIQGRETIQTLRAHAIAQGMIEFRHSALLKVARGETSIEEVFRVVPSEYLGVEL